MVKKAICCKPAQYFIYSYLKRLLLIAGRIILLLLSDLSSAIIAGLGSRGSW
jgi:hypothetical protein